MPMLKIATGTFYYVPPGCMVVLQPEKSTSIAFPLTNTPTAIPLSSSSSNPTTLVANNANVAPIVSTSKDDNALFLDSLSKMTVSPTSTKPVPASTNPDSGLFDEDIQRMFDTFFSEDIPPLPFESSSSATLQSSSDDSICADDLFRDLDDLLSCPSDLGSPRSESSDIAPTESDITEFFDESTFGSLTSSPSSSTIAVATTNPSSSSSSSSNLVSDNQQKTGGSKKSERARRPMNAFIIYRLEKHNELWEFLHSEQGLTNNQVSKIIGQMWAKEPEEVKQLYHQEALRRKEQHELQHPNYKFAPRKDKKKKGSRTGNSTTDIPITQSITKPVEYSLDDAISMTIPPTTPTRRSRSSTPPQRASSKAAKRSAQRYQPYLSPEATRCSSQTSPRTPSDTTIPSMPLSPAATSSPTSPEHAQKSANLFASFSAAGRFPTPPPLDELEKMLLDFN